MDDNETVSSAAGTSMDTGTTFRRPAKSSKAWDHATFLANGSYKCNYCSKVYGSGSSSETFNRHLKEKHSDVLTTTMEHVIAAPIIAPFDQETATRRFIKCDLQPFSTADSPELRDFIESLNPQHRPPSRT